MASIPVTIITGFLGSGKTTLLNNILSEEHGKKLAVIVNEIGKIGIDNQLIVNTDEEILEMTNGCICCTVREDLLVALKKLLQSKLTGKTDFEGVLIETTGLANPGPIISTFFLDPTIQQAYFIDGVVTVVDGYHIFSHMEKGLEAKEQIAFADIILLNKTDLFDNGQEVMNQIQVYNPTAKIIPCLNSQVGVGDLLNIRTFTMKDKLEIYQQGEHEGHLEGVTAFVIREEQPLDLAKLNQWMTAVVAELGEFLYRYKGIIAVKDMEQRVVFQGVHTLFAGKVDRAWRADEPRVTEIVFIGKGLNKDWFATHLKECIEE